ncbi:hypothetical protein [Flavobacterium sp. HJSW_4]|uniref:hypothetical protein n=1 Tax=Flavobacterium sp. HJSW_4 TaxID=3344660 RepID=UPI0035F3D5B3
MKNLTLLFLCLFCLSCGKKEDKNNITTKTLQDTFQQKKVADTLLVSEKNIQTGDTIFMKSKNENNIYTAEGSLNATNSKVYIKFTNQDSKNLKAKIIIPESGNIRFNQIISPDKTSDGPFGFDLETKMEQKGDYILVIGHSQMAENPYVGKFVVQLEM